MADIKQEPKVEPKEEPKEELEPAGPTGADADVADAVADVKAEFDEAVVIARLKELLPKVDLQTTTGTSAVRTLGPRVTGRGQVRGQGGRATMQTRTGTWRRAGGGRWAGRPMGGPAMRAIVDPHGEQTRGLANEVPQRRSAAGPATRPGQLIPAGTPGCPKNLKLSTLSMSTVLMHWNRAHALESGSCIGIGLMHWNRGGCPNC
jgi:hypothetical protein